MRRVAACAVLACLVAGAAAQDGGGERVFGGGDRSTLRLEVRGRPTLTQPGKVVADARAAWVQAGESPAEAATRAVRTDADGRVEMQVPDGGAVLLLWKAGLTPSAHWFARGGDQRLHMAVARRLEGRVVGAAREPVPGAAVTLEVQLPLIGAPAGGPRAHVFARTLVADAAGRFGFDDLSDAPTELRADADGWVPASLYPVHPGGRSVDLVLGRGASVSGSVSLLPSGGPAVGVVVSIAGREAPVGDDGTFLVETIPAGVHELRVEGSGFVPPAPRRLVLKDGQRRSSLVVELLEGATFEGVLRDGRGHAVTKATFRFVFPPLATAPGALAETAAAFRELVREVAADEAGRFRVADLLPAEGVTLEVRTETYVPLLVEGIALRPGEVARPAELVLSAGGVIEGRVLDAAGEPLGAADVEVFVADSLRSEPVRSAQTDAEGAFTLRGVPGGGVRLRVRPPASHLERPGEFGPFAARDAELVRVGALRLDPGHVLAGRVDGAPDGAVIRAYAGKAVVAEAPVERGLFELRGLAPGDVTLEATSEDVNGLAVAEAVVPSRTPLYLTWLDARHVTGRLVDDRGRAVSVAHLVVQAMASASDEDAAPLEPPRELELRDAEGRFGFELLPGRWRITASTDDGRFGGTEFALGRLGDPPRVTIELAAGEAVQGHVVDAETGAPLEGARIRALPVAGSRDVASPEAVADERGFFRVPGVPPGMIRLRIEADGYAPHESELLSVRRAAAPYVGRIEVQPGVRVLGRITARGLPVPGATVILEDDDGHRGSARTDLHGRYEIAGMAAGSAVLFVQTPDRQPQRAVRVLLRPRPNGFLLDLDLDDGARITGRVIAFGRPEPYADVVAWTFGSAPTAAEVRTDPHGRFSLPPLPPGQVRISVQAAGTRVAHEYDLELPDTYEHFVELELPEASITGAVVARDGGDPVAGAFVRLMRSEGTYERVAGEAVTDRHGRFQLERVPPGVYVAVVSRRGYGTVAREQFTVYERDVQSDVRFELPEEAWVELGVRDMRGRPIPGAELAARRHLPEGGVQVRRASADWRGRVRLGGLAPDDWELTVSAPGFARHYDVVRWLDPGANVLLDVALERGALLRIRVVGAFLEPVAGIGVTVQDALGFDPRGGRRPDDRLRGADRAYVTDARGEVLISSLNPGVYWVWTEGAAEDDLVSVRVGDAEIRSVFLFAP